MQIRQISVKPSIIVYINTTKWVYIDASVIEYLPMVLAGYVVYNVLLVKAGR